MFFRKNLEIISAGVKALLYKKSTLSPMYKTAAANNLCAMVQ